jgi:hypothetical protein
MLAHPSGGQFLFHMSSFPSRPVSARSGRKEFIENKIEIDNFRRNAVLSADTVAP